MQSIGMIRAAALGAGMVAALSGAAAAGEYHLSVDRVTIDTGEFTRTGIGTIVDMESLEVEVDVSESFINRVAAGQPVTVRLNAYPDWSIPGRVITVAIVPIDAVPPLMAKSAVSTDVGKAPLPARTSSRWPTSAPKPASRVFSYIESTSAPGARKP